MVPTIGFRLLCALVIARLARRELVWIDVTAHPTADWIAQQITEAFPWNEAPRYLIRDSLTRFTLLLSLVAREPWVFATSQSRLVPRGRTVLWND